MKDVVIQCHNCDEQIHKSMCDDPKHDIYYTCVKLGATRMVRNDCWFEVNGVYYETNSGELNLILGRKT